MAKTGAREAIPLLAVLVAATAPGRASRRWLPLVGGAENFVSDLRVVALPPQVPPSKNVVTPTLALSLAAGLTGTFRRRGHGEGGC